MDNEIDYFAVFGVDPPSEKRQDAADPEGSPKEEQPEGGPDAGGSSGQETVPAAQDPQDPDGGDDPDDSGDDETQGAQEPEAAEPAGDQTKDSPAGAGETGEKEPEAAEPTGNTEKDASMSRQERRKQAELRRQRELDDAVTKARQEERDAAAQREKQFFERAKIKNPLKGDGAFIGSFEDFEKWQGEKQRADMEQELADGKLTPQTLENMLAGLPEVQKARQLAERAEAEHREAEKREFAQKMERELTEIRKLDPSVKDLPDILALPTGQKFARYVRENRMTYLDAFKLANEERLAARRAQADRARTLNRINSKSHLTAHQQRGGGMREVPQDQMEVFRGMFPGMSAEEIQKEYNRWTKN